MLQLINKLLRNTRGVALVEFVLVFPLIMLLILVSAEFTRYFLINLRLQKAAYAIGNIVTQYPAATATPAKAGEINQDEIFNTLSSSLVSNMMGPNMSALVIVSSLYKQPGDRLVIKWQTASYGPGGCGFPSLTTQWGVPAMASFTKNWVTNGQGRVVSEPYKTQLAGMADGENIIAVEVIYGYAPLYSDMFQAIANVFPDFNFGGLHGNRYANVASDILYKVAFFTPRNGDLTCLPPAAGGASNTFFSYQSCPCTNNSYDGGCTSLPQ